MMYILTMTHINGKYTLKLSNFDIDQKYEI